jgi:hypothetical protein
MVITEVTERNCCQEIDLKPLNAKKDWKFCVHCGRNWKKCEDYVGEQLEVVYEWLPMPWPWERITMRDENTGHTIVLSAEITK